jgi:hypothetical protein
MARMNAYTFSDSGKDPDLAGIMVKYIIRNYEAAGIQIKFNLGVVSCFLALPNVILGQRAINGRYQEGVFTSDKGGSFDELLEDSRSRFALARPVPSLASAFDPPELDVIFPIFVF